MKMKGAQILIQSLIDQGTDTVFGYPGGAVLNIYDALYERKNEIRHILTSHEQGAAHAADGYARSSGKTGVVIATSGPGATNLVTGIATAFLDSVPMVAITGNVALDLIGRDSFQEIDIAGITMPITKHNYIVKNVAELQDTVSEAFVIANSGRCGPVLIDIPKDITAQETEYVKKEKFLKRVTPEPDAAEIETAAAAINRSNRPMIYSGGGVVSSGATKELLAFSKRINAPVAATIPGISAVPYDYPLYLGMIGMHGTAAANKAPQECDLLIAVGARFSDRVASDRRRFATNAEILHIDIDPSEISKNVRCGLSVTGDAKRILSLLAEKTERKTDGGWAHEMVRYKAQNALPAAAPEGLSPRDIIREVRNCFGPDTIIVTDVGQHQMFTAQFYECSRPRTFITSAGLGTMGFGLGAAIGAKTANPDKPVVLITGDGSFHMNMNELATAVTENIPLTILVMNNGVLGMVRQWQKLFYGERYSGTTLSRKTDLVRL
ncbi:MAG: biosynthetic-type acetolactate synthase large subunit, partial [Bacillota bacterium]|nr:biosynthetic-type acetolactate synthase large subunit [Bacillota bacterium]